MANRPRRPPVYPLAALAAALLAARPRVGGERQPEAYGAARTGQPTGIPDNYSG
jgi:hypothetical protein